MVSYHPNFVRSGHQPASAELRNNSYLNEQIPSLILAVSTAAFSVFRLPYYTFPSSLCAAFAGTQVSKNLSLTQNAACITATIIMLKYLCLYDPELSFGIIHSSGLMFALAQFAQTIVTNYVQA